MQLVSTEDLATEGAQAETPQEGGGAELMAALVAETVRQFRRELRENERVVRASADAEGVHDMRVATRALRAQLDVFVEIGALGAGDGRRVSRRLRRLARALGRVRDLDVMAESGTDYIAANAGTAEALADWMESLSRRHRDARKRLLRVLDSRAYKRLRGDLRRLGKQPRTRAGGESLRLRACAGSAIWRRYEAVSACGAPEGPEGQTPEAIHELRIACKRLRYVVDLFAEALGPERDPVREALTRSQKTLGAAHDVSTRLAALRRYDRRHGAAQGLREYIQAETKRLESLTAEAAAVRVELDGEPFRRALAAAIAGL